MSGPELKPCPFCGGEASASGILLYTKTHQAWWPDGSQILKAHYVNCMRCSADNKQMFGHQTQADAIAAWNTRTDLTPPAAIAAQALARAEAAEAALEAEMPWTIETPNLEEYGHAIARAALEAAISKCEAARGHRNKQRAELTPHDPAQVQRWIAGAIQANTLADQIRAIIDDPAALAEIVGRVKG